jgi:AI-2 transport system substrate-binding protein
VTEQGITKRIFDYRLCIPDVIMDYCSAGLLSVGDFGICGIQGAMGAICCLLASRPQSRSAIRLTSGIGEVEIMPKYVLVSGATTAATNNGVVLMPERTVFTKDNMNNYNF